MNGEDLISLIHEDLLSDLGATNIQTRKIKNELSRLGVSIPASPHAAQGIPAAHQGIPANQFDHQPEMVTKKSQESAEIAELKRKLQEETLKNDLRKEMDMTSRIAATEAAQRAAAAAASPMVINNNNNNNAGGMGKERSSSVVVTSTRTEHYCGCLSFLVFFCFPCIVCCPIDERQVESSKVIHT